MFNPTQHCLVRVQEVEAYIQDELERGHLPSIYKMLNNDLLTHYKAYVAWSEKSANRVYARNYLEQITERMVTELYEVLYKVLKKYNKQGLSRDSFLYREINFILNLKEPC